MQRPESAVTPPPDFDAELAADVSRSFWLEDRSKIEIAEEFHLSRFKVARILEEARRYGVVRIDIAEPSERIGRLAEQVREAFGLVDVALARRPASANGTLAELGSLAAAYLTSHVSPGSTIGLGWGSTLAQVVSHLTPSGPVDVVQLAGGFASSASDFNGSSLVTAASDTLGGSPYLLYAPALVATPDARASLRAEHTVARTVAKYKVLDAMMTGIGVFRASPQSALYRGDVLSSSVHSELDRWDVVGDTCCHFIDGNGFVVPALAERAIGISVDEIRAIPLRIAVAAGVDKRPPILAALRSGLPNVLITDVDTARAILPLAPEPTP
jgi:DNA-binding transcriptional regulator LsrR (DeoR family)